MELLKHKLGEIEQLAKGRGLGGIFKLKPAQTEIEKSTAVWSNKEDLSKITVQWLNSQFIDGLHFLQAEVSSFHSFHLGPFLLAGHGVPSVKTTKIEFLFLLLGSKLE